MVNRQGMTLIMSSIN